MSTSRGTANRSVMAGTTRSRRPQGVTPRSYQAKVDLCRLWDLMIQGRSQAEMARLMGKDPAWISRSVKRIQADFSTVYQRPAESAMVNDQLARLEALYMKAMRSFEDGSGMAQVAALRTAATIMKDLREFKKFVGLINEQQENSPIDQLARGFGF